MAAPIAAAPDAIRVPALQPVPLRELLPWVVFAGLMLLMLLYFVGAEQGATSLVGGHMVHEFLHDARHTLAFPCH